MVWRDVLSRIVGAALEEALSCSESCGKILIAAADAVYAPLAPIDTGSGELKAFASRLAGIVAHAYVYRIFPEGIEAIRSVLNEAEELVRSGGEVEEAKRILEKAGAAFEPRPAEEPRVAVLNSLRYYVQMYDEYQEALESRRRRRGLRPPSQQDAVRHIRRLLREVGRRDAFLAKSISMQLRQHGIPV